MKPENLNIDPLLWEILPDGRRVPSPLLTALHSRDLLTREQKDQVRAWMHDCAARVSVSEEEIDALTVELQLALEAEPSEADADRALTFDGVLRRMAQYWAELAVQFNLATRAPELITRGQLAGAAEVAADPKPLRLKVDPNKVLDTFARNLATKVAADPILGASTADFRPQHLATLVLTVIASGDLPAETASPLMDLVRLADRLTLQLGEASERGELATMEELATVEVEWVSSVVDLESAMASHLRGLKAAYGLANEWELGGASRLGRLWELWVVNMDRALRDGVVQ